MSLLARTVSKHEEAVKAEVRREEDQLAERRRKTAGQIVAEIDAQTERRVNEDQRKTTQEKLDKLRHRYRTTRL